MAQRFGEHLRQLRNGKPRCVGRKDGCLGDKRRDFFVQRFLPVHALGDGLDDQVAAAQQFQVIVVIGLHDLRGFALHRERIGRQFHHALDRLTHHAVFWAFFRGQVEQDGVDIGIGQMRGNLGAHDTGTEDGDFTDMKITQFRLLLINNQNSLWDGLFQQ